MIFWMVDININHHESYKFYRSRSHEFQYTQQFQPSNSYESFSPLWGFPRFIYLPPCFCFFLPPTKNLSGTSSPPPGHPNWQKLVRPNAPGFSKTWSGDGGLTAVVVVGSGRHRQIWCIYLKENMSIFYQKETKKSVNKNRDLQGVWLIFEYFILFLWNPSKNKEN